MKRSEFLLNSTLLAASAFLPLKELSKLWQSPFTPLRRNVGYFTGSGGSIGWLANKDALVAVDSQFPDSAKTCLEGLQEMTKHPMDLLINTHHHGDHTAGNPVFKQVAKHIVAHKNVPALQKAAAERRGKETLSQQVYADQVFDTRWKQDVGDETVHGMHFGAAHTGGDAVIYFEKANVAHMGDLVFNRAYPFIDRAGGASIVNWVNVLETTVKELNNDTIYIFGHGNAEFGVSGSKDDVLLKANFLEALLEFTQNGIDKGISKETLMETKTLKGFEVFDAPGWSLSLTNNIDVAYQELTEK